MIQWQGATGIINWVFFWFNTSGDSKEGQLSTYFYIYQCNLIYVGMANNHLVLMNRLSNPSFLPIENLSHIQ